MKRSSGFTSSDLPTLLHKTLPRKTRDPLAPSTAPARTFVLPWPPSTNKLWLHRGNRRICTPEYENYKRSAGLYAASIGITPVSGRIDVTLWLHFPPTGGDSDRHKAILDAINGVAWNDDGQIRHLLTYRIDNAAKPKVVIRIEPAIGEPTPPLFEGSERP